MANKNFFIHNGLTVGAFSVDASTGNLVSTGTVTLTTTTNSTSKTSGALVVAGGIGVGGSAFVGGNLTVEGTLNATVSGSITTATNLSGGAAGSLPYQSAAGFTTYRNIGTAGFILQSDGTAPQWVSTASVLAGLSVAAATPAIRGTVFGVTEDTCFNTSLGFCAGNTTMTGNDNVAVGQCALRNNSLGSYNVALGFRALCANDTGTQNTAIGFRALYGNTSGFSNVAVGATTLFNNTTGNYNIAVGSLVLAGNRNGNNNIGIGCGALRNANSPSGNLAIGTGAGCGITTGACNVLIGANTGSSIATSNCNIIVSDGAGTARITVNASGAHAYDAAGSSFGTAGQLLCSGGNAATPGWISQSAITVGFVNNLTGGAGGSIVYQTATNQTGMLAIGTLGNVLTAGATAPQWSAQSSLNVGSANNVNGGSAGQILCQTGAGATGFVNTSSLMVANAVVAGSAETATRTTNLSGGAAGQLHYQSAANTSAFLGAGTAGQILVSAGTTSTGPVFTNTSSITVGFAGYAVTAGSAASATTANCATNIAGGTAGQLVCQTGPNATGFVNTSSLMVANAVVAGSAGTAGSATTANCATNIAGGTAGGIPYQRAANTTDFIGIGSAGTFLVSNGTTATWISTATLGSGGTSAPATPNTLGLVFGYTTGAGNVAIGCCAGNITQTGTGNFAVSCSALVSNTIGSDNVAIGCAALNANSTGCHNIAIGCKSLTANTLGSCNIAIGSNAGSAITTGTNNTIIGNLAAGSGCVCTVLIGAGTCERIKVDNNGLCINGSIYAGLVGSSTFFGNNSGNTSVTGAFNTAVGQSALRNVLAGGFNTALGFSAMCANTGGNFNTAIGLNSLLANTVGSGNTAIGLNALRDNTTGGSNVAIGQNALQNATASQNVAVGVNALAANTTGQYNIAIGYWAGTDVTSGSNNTIIGTLAGSAGLQCTVLIGAGSCERIKVDNNGLCINGSLAIAAGASLVAATPNTAGIVLGCTTVSGTCRNTSLGLCSLANFTTTNVQGENTAIGAYAMQYNTSGCYNTAVGSGAMSIGTTGSSNTAIGNSALIFNTGSFNVAVGANSLFYNMNGSGNVAVGHCALVLNTRGNCNIAIGPTALYCNTTGSANIAIGYGSLWCNKTGLDNVAIGYQANNFNILGCNNVALGSLSLQYSKSGSRNIAIGNRAMLYNEVGSDNVALGDRALFTNQTGNYNIGIGTCAGYNITTACHNISIGYGSLYGNRTGCHNIAIGCRSLCGNLTSNNIGIGHCAGCSFTTGNNNTVIGSLPGAAGCVCTLLLGAGTCERIKVDDSGLTINGAVSGGLTLNGTICGTNSGNLTITMPASSGSPRCINIIGQAGYTTAGPGGTINITGGVGQSTTGGLGGNVCITAGNATVGDNQGGNIILTGGQSHGTGSPGYVRVISTNTALSTDTGALQVLGGVGITGHMVVGGQICGVRDGYYNWATNGVWASGAAVFAKSISSVISTNGWTIDMTATNVLRIGSGSVTGVPGTRMSICNNGDVCVTNSLYSNSLGVGTAASGTAGEIRATNNITAYYSSDCRLKTNITPISNAVCKVQQISGVLYDWTDDYIEKQGGEDGIFVRKRDVGLIAQEIEKILPEIVVDRQDGFKAIKYERVVALLVEAIKELKSDFDRLESKVGKE